MINLDKIKDFGKGLVVVVGILTAPYVALNSVDNTLYALKTGQREYMECAGVRKLENRKNVLEAQKRIFNDLCNKVVRGEKLR